MFKPDLTPNGSDQFSNAWQTYRQDSLALHEEVLFPEIIRLLEISSTATNILVDAGCGDGQLTYEATRALKPQRVIALDNDSSLLARAKIRDQSFECMQSNLRLGLQLPFRADAIICCNLLMHLGPEEAQLFLNTARQCLQPSGRMVVAVTHSEWVKKSCNLEPAVTFPLSIQRNWNGKSVPHTYFEKDGYERLFSEAGLAVVNHTELEIRDLPGLARRYAENVGTPIYHVFLVAPAAHVNFAMPNEAHTSARRNLWLSHQLNELTLAGAEVREVRKIYSKLNELLEKVIEDNDAASQLFTSLGEKLDSMSSRLCVKDDSDISNGRAVLASRRAFRDYLREMSEVGMFDVEEAIKRSEVLDLMKLREKTVDKNLQRLCEEGFLIKTGLGEYRPSNMTLALHRAGLLSL